MALLSKRHVGYKPSPSPFFKEAQIDFLGIAHIPWEKLISLNDKSTHTIQNYNIRSRQVVRSVRVGGGRGGETNDGGRPNNLYKTRFQVCFHNTWNYATPKYPIKKLVAPQP